MSNPAKKVAFGEASSVYGSKANSRSNTDTDRLREAYAECRKIALGHYENFPVGSILLPANVRPDFFALYAFMRTADDLADLPDRSIEEKLALLGDWRSQLHRSFDRAIPDEDISPLFLALRYTCRKHRLSRKPFDRLLDAFEFDARGDVEFAGFEELMWYCDRSANPVGELVLALFGYRDSHRIALSNSICTGLQLLNFCQDVKEDLVNGRVYFAQEDLRHGGVRDLTKSDEIAKAVVLQMAHVRKLLRAGSPLTEMVQGRLRYELRAVINGAIAMLKKLEQRNGNSFVDRPKLSKMEHLWVLAKSLLSRPRP